MTRLFLLRHAKAAEASVGMRDTDRPLDATGKAEAEAIGVALRLRNHAPDTALCSNARRARETLDGVVRNASVGRIVFSDALYREDAEGYLALIRDTAQGGSLLVVGHNPTIHELAATLVGAGPGGTRAALNAGFPTCGLAILRFPGGLEEAAPGAGYLEAFLSPAAP